MRDFPERIVYVDDNQDHRTLVRKTLERSGEDFVLVTCGGGRELITRIRELRPDLILLDMRMPMMSGPDTVEELRKSADYNEAAIIFLTGADKLEMQQEYNHLGVLGVIHKPIDVHNFAEEIKVMWQSRPEKDNALNA